MNYKIKHHYSDKILFEVETTSMKIAIELAIKENVELSGADLHDFDLSGCDLSGCDLSYSDLRYSNLSYSNLSNSNLHYSNLSYSDLSYSDLSNSDLSNSNLRGSNLRDTNVITFQYQKHLAICTGERLIIGCEDKSLAEWSSVFREIGEKAKYTELEINMYGKFIEMCGEAQVGEK